MSRSRSESSDSSATPIMGMPPNPLMEMPAQHQQKPASTASVTNKTMPTTPRPVLKITEIPLTPLCEEVLSALRQLSVNAPVSDGLQALMIEIMSREIAASGSPDVLEKKEQTKILMPKPVRSKDSHPSSMLPESEYTPSPPVASESNMLSNTSGQSWTEKTSGRSKIKCVLQ